MDIKTLIAALCGVVVGSLLKELGVWFQSYRDGKRVLKRVLFNQLVLWFELKKTDVDYILQKLLPQLEKELLKRGASPQDVQQLLGGTIPALSIIFRSVKLGDPSKVVLKYQESVNGLAEIDPILAYRLSGKADDDFQELMDNFVVSTKNFVGIAEMTPVDATIIDQLTTYSRGQILEKTLNGLEKDIGTTAIRIHVWTRMTVARELKKLEARIGTVAAEQASGLVENMIGIYQSISPQNVLPTDSDLEEGRV